MADELDGIPVFVAVAEELGFRAAGKRLGVSGSAVSHALRRLEERLGITLVHRTTRSVSLSEAGERFYAAVRPLLEDLRGAVAEVGELAEHPCINWKATPDAAAYRWEFTEEGHDFSVAVHARVLTNELPLMIRLALSGVGLAMAWESQVREHVERGELVPVLERYSTPFPGFYLYYPDRRHTSPALRALIDYLLRARRDGVG